MEPTSKVTPRKAIPIRKDFRPEAFVASLEIFMPFILAGVPQLCPVQPIDCNTVFQNNVGQTVDPTITGALVPLIQALH